MIIKISKEGVRLLIERARAEYPIEICGVLFGLIHENEVCVTKIVMLKNILRSENMFQIDPEEFLKEVLKSEEEGLQHIGFFHSHAGDTRPSRLDLKYMGLWPESVWLIISSTSCTIAAYKCLNKNFQEIPIIIE